MTQRATDDCRLQRDLRPAQLCNSFSVAHPAVIRLLDNLDIPRVALDHHSLLRFRVNYLYSPRPLLVIDARRKLVQAMVAIAAVAWHERSLSHVVWTLTSSFTIPVKLEPRLMRSIPSAT